MSITDDTRRLPEDDAPPLVQKDGAAFVCVDEEGARWAINVRPLQALVQTADAEVMVWYQGGHYEITETPDSGMGRFSPIRLDPVVSYSAALNVAREVCAALTVEAHHQRALAERLAQESTDRVERIVRLRYRMGVD